MKDADSDAVDIAEWVTRISKIPTPQWGRFYGFDFDVDVDFDTASLPMPKILQTMHFQLTTVLSSLFIQPRSWCETSNKNNPGPLASLASLGIGTLRSSFFLSHPFVSSLEFLGFFIDLFSEFIMH